MLSIVIVVGIVLLIMVFNLRSRVEELEKKIGSKVPQQIPSPTPALAAAPSIAPVQPIIPIAAAATGPSSGDRFLSWLKENWLLKLGALLLLMGFGWLVTYAFLNNWIGPSGRIAFGLVAGALILILGAWRIRIHVTEGSVFVALGATVILLRALPLIT